MKKTYIIPQTIVYSAQCENILAASRLETGSNSQNIEFTDDEYEGEFNTKEFSSPFDDAF